MHRQLWGAFIEPQLWLKPSLGDTVPLIFVWVEYLEGSERRVKKSSRLLLRQAFHDSYLTNVEVLLLVFCYSDGPNTCPFGGTVTGDSYKVVAVRVWLFSSADRRWDGRPPCMLYINCDHSCSTAVRNSAIHFSGSFCSFRY